MSTPLRLVTPANAPALLIDAWTTTMAGQGLSERTVTERRRVIIQLARDTGTDPVALTSTTLSAWLATLPSAATREAYYSIVRAWSRPQPPTPTPEHLTTNTAPSLLGASGSPHGRSVDAMPLW